MVYSAKCYQKQKYCQISIPILVKKYEAFIMDTQMILKKEKDDSNTILVSANVCSTHGKAEGENDFFFVGIESPLHY